MTVRSTQSHAEALLYKKVAESRTSGAMAPDVEAAALLESLGISLSLAPRSILYIEYLARNGLLAAVTNSLNALADLRSTIVDLTNTTYAVKDLSHLESAKNSLLQLEGLPRVSTSTGVFQRFSRAVDSFLSSQLAKNVRTPGSATLTRPGLEASSDLQPAMQKVRDLYEDFLSRLYALTVGVSNFSSSNLSSILSTSTVVRSRTDLEDLIQSFQEDDTGSLSRDAAVRLITSRAAIRVLGNPPSPFDPVADVAASSDGVSAKFTVDVDLTDTVSPGDSVVWSSGTATVKKVTPTEIKLDTVPTVLYGETTIITIVSSLVPFHSNLSSALLSFVKDFSVSKFGNGVEVLDAAVAPLVGAPTAAQQNSALTVLDSLVSNLTDLSSVLDAFDLPTRSALPERKVVNGLIQSLQERKYDRALSLLLRCQIVEVFELDYKTLSFSGNLVQSLSDVAHSDVSFPGIGGNVVGRVDRG